MATKALMRKSQRPRTAYRVASTMTKCRLQGVCRGGYGIQWDRTVPSTEVFSVLAEAGDLTAMWKTFLPA